MFPHISIIPLPQPLHLRVLSPFLSSPPILSHFIHFTFEAYRGYSGSFGGFRSIVFIVASQVSSSIVDRENSSHPNILSPTAPSPFSSISYLFHHSSILFLILSVHSLIIIYIKLSKHYTSATDFFTYSVFYSFLSLYLFS